ncbi:uncharacterized protein LOC133300446 [Gastrolobium bilobum]|uniref:uncharacterized protein LOC133300446 n=1 Tax=Gastrolobium bilobum TaxID=150636 RepID=UPI002AB047CB|nr:uncharacterized protein LOC133300446 [Gastrolobium bilobum]
MQVVVQSPSHSPSRDNFDFSGAMSSSYLSAPSSPKRFGEYFLSAPASPTRLSQLYSEFDYFSPSTTPFEAPTNNVDGDDDDDDDGFAFSVSIELDKSSRSAEELFDGGKIKPFKPEDDEVFAFHKSKVVSQKQHNNKTHRRGRDRTPATVLSSSNSGRRVTRSHSPYRKSWEEEQQPRINKEESTLSSNTNLSSSSSSSKGSRRWRLRDLLLFRSASEGRGSSKEQFKKLKAEEVKGSSFRSSDSSSAHGSRRKGIVSPHELHYAIKKAESQDLKKRTFLPYKPGIFGRLSGFGL